MQAANWESIREQRNDFADVLMASTVGKVQAAGNGVVVTYDDGSEVTWTPSITANAEESDDQPR